MSSNIEKKLYARIQATKKESNNQFVIRSTKVPPSVKSRAEKLIHSKKDADVWRGVKMLASILYPETPAATSTEKPRQVKKAPSKVASIMNQEVPAAASTEKPQEVKKVPSKVASNLNPETPSATSTEKPREKEKAPSKVVSIINQEVPAAASTEKPREKKGAPSKVVSIMNQEQEVPAAESTEKLQEVKKVPSKVASLLNRQTAAAAISQKPREVQKAPLKADLENAFGFDSSSDDMEDSRSVGSEFFETATPLRKDSKSKPEKSREPLLDMTAKQLRARNLSFRHKIQQPAKNPVADPERTICTSTPNGNVGDRTVENSLFSFAWNERGSLDDTSQDNVTTSSFISRELQNYIERPYSKQRLPFVKPNPAATKERAVRFCEDETDEPVNARGRTSTAPKRTKSKAVTYRKRTKRTTTKKRHVETEEELSEKEAFEKWVRETNEEHKEIEKFQIRVEVVERSTEDDISAKPGE